MLQEYTARTGRRYARGGKTKGRVILKEFTGTTYFSRNYAGKILAGKRKYRVSPERGRDYDVETAETPEKIWRWADCMNTEYLKGMIGKWVSDCAMCVAVISSTGG